MRELLKAAFKTGIGSGGFLLLGIISTKILAVILGPGGVGLYSIARQTVETSKVLGTLGGEGALLQGLASRKGKMQDYYLVTTFWVFLSGALLAAVAMFSFAPWIASWAFGSSDGQTVHFVRWLALPVALAVTAAYFNMVLNGFMAIGMMAIIQLSGAVAMALLAYPVSRLVETGYLSAFIVMVSAPPAVGTALALWTALRAGWLAPLLGSSRVFIHSDSLRHFSSLALTVLVTGLSATGVNLAVRSLVVQYEGLVSAGIFATAWTLSMTYLMLVLSSFGTYLMPTLSGTSDPEDRIVLLQRALKLVSLLAVPIITCVVVLKPLVIQLLYTSEFMPALDIIRWMLIGDYLKATAWVIATPALAYADTRVYLVTELSGNTVFLIFSAVALIGVGSMQGTGMAFLLMYVIYVAYYLHYVRNRHRFPLTRDVMGPWLLGLIFIIGVSWYTWSDTQVNWVAAPLWVGAALCFAWLSLKRSERKEVLRTVLRRKEMQY